MFGIGKLYALFNDNGESFIINNIVFYQCPDIFNGKRNGYFQSVWRLTIESGVKNGFIDSSTTQFLISGNKQASPTFCSERTFFDHHTGFSLGQNHEATVRAWKMDLKNTFDEYARFEPELGARSTNCSQLRIGIFTRSGGRALRKFLNLQAVVELAETFSNRVTTFTLSEESSLSDAIIAFNSFDILITPHGSHLTNGILIGREEKPHIIEVVATCVNDDFRRNLEKHFVFYEISTGHLSASAQIQERIKGCGTNRGNRGCQLTANCSFGAVRESVQTDLFVNVTLLRASLERAVREQCQKCSHGSIDLEGEGLQVQEGKGAEK